MRSSRRQSSQNHLKIKDQACNALLLRYHEKVLLKAIEAQKHPPEERHYRSLSLALSRQEYQEFLTQQNSFIQNIFARFESHTLEERRIYQVNFNLFPWTGAPTEKNLKSEA